MTKERLTDKQMAGMSPWAIAKHLGIGYHGDYNPINHGGHFYDLRDWEKWGYASCVEFWEDPETLYIVVQRGTVNKLTGEALASAFKYIGMAEDDPDRDTPDAQINACQYYAGIEPDGTRHPDLKVFNLETWRHEWRIWKSIRCWIEQLGE